MGIITWQNVPTGDLSGAQEGIRTASALFERAARAGTAATDQVQAMQAAERQAAQDAANKALMSEVFKMQNPGELQQRMSDGSLVNGAIARGASLDTLKQANAQIGVLQSREQADQKLKTDQQSFTQQDYLNEHLKKTNAIDEKLGSIVAEIMPLAEKSPSQAEAILTKRLQEVGLTDVSASQLLPIMRESRNQYIDKSAWARLAMDQREKGMQGEAALLIHEFKRKFQGAPGKIPGALNEYVESSKDKQRAAMIAGIVGQTFGKEVPNIAGITSNFGNDAPTPSTGAADSDSELVQDVERSLSSGAKVLLKAEKSGLNDKTAGTVAALYGKEYGLDPIELAAKARKLHGNAKFKGTDITEAEVVGALVESVQQSGILNMGGEGVLNWDNFAKGVDLIEGDAQKIIDMAGKHRAELTLAKNVASLQKRFNEASNAVTTANSSIAIARAAHESKMGDEGGALEKAEAAKARALQKKKDAYDAIQSLAAKHRKQQEALEK